MTRVQILLPEEDDRQLEQLARRQGESKSNVVRRALQHLLRFESTHDESLLGLIGQAGASGRRHAARDHDRLLTQSHRRTR